MHIHKRMHTYVHTTHTYIHAYKHMMYTIQPCRTLFVEQGFRSEREVGRLEETRALGTQEILPFPAAHANKTLRGHGLVTWNGQTGQHSEVSLWLPRA